MTARPSRPSRRRRIGASLAALAALALAGSLSAGPAIAAPGEGQVVLSLAGGKAESSLAGQGVKVTYSAKAGKTGATKSAVRGGKGKSGSAKATLPVTDLELLEAATIRTSGVLALSAGKRQARLREVVLRTAGEQTAVSAKLGKRRLIFFRAQGKAEVGKSSLALTKAPLSLTGKGADALRKRLGLDGLDAGPSGALSVDAQLLTEEPKTTPPASKQPDPDPVTPVDPYLQECGVAATSEVAGNLPDPASPPELTSAKSTVAPSDVTWGFKAGFRSYVIFGAGGTLQTLDGASTNGAPPVISSFDFPVTEGAYDDNDPIDTTDDQAVVEGSGRALFCATGHGFRVVISNPTVIVDGEDSRIVADLDTNLSGAWTPEQRIDLADLDLDGITPFYNRSGSEVTWGQVPTTLTAEGAEAICGDGGCSYVEGTALDPIDVAVKTAYDTGDLNALATYVAAELPFPLSDPSQGGCTLPAAAGGTQSAARTIDEYLAIGPGTSFQWVHNAGQAVAEPDLSAATAVTGGNFDWGFRSSLRGSVSGTGDFNLAGGATASNPYFGNGGSLGSRPSQMSGAGKYFRWPASGSAGHYDAGAAGDADDRLVLRTGGRVAFCQVGTNQWYGTVLSNPTVVIDGANSRVTIDVATRYRLSWVRGRVDFASLDLSGATFGSTTDAGITTVSWTLPDAVSNVGPVELTKAGEAVVNVLSSGTYLEGLGLDGATIKATFPTPGP